jgi:hypothetical protein
LGSIFFRLNLSLWILSIFGNQGSLDNWGFSSNNKELLFFIILGAMSIIIGLYFEKKLSE